ncbi:MAG: PHP domain-containing protein [Candidatus Krumholzibacteriia bacterium]
MTSAPFCDLHTHTLHSDGMLTPGELVELAAARGVRVLAVTDHDTLGGTAAAVRRGRSLGIEVIEGIELSVDMHGRELHLLGYFVQRPSALEEGLAEIRSAREVRARRIVGRLGELGMPVEYAAVWGRARGDVVGRPHGAASRPASTMPSTASSETASPHTSPSGRSACSAASSSCEARARSPPWRTHR